MQSELPAVPSLALGSAEVTLMEMTRAFAAIAANAENIEPYAIDSIQKGRSSSICAAESVLTHRAQSSRAGGHP